MVGCDFLLSEIPKEKGLTNSKRKIVFNLHNEGKSVKYICGMFNRCHKTIHNVIKDANLVGKTANISRKVPQNLSFPEVGRNCPQNTGKIHSYRHHKLKIN